MSGYGICAPCFHPVDQWHETKALHRIVHEGELFEGMYLVHRGECAALMGSAVAAFEASLPTADDVQGILAPQSGSSPT